MFRASSLLPPGVVPSIPTGLLQESNCSIDLKSLDELLQREDFNTIVKDKNLFWANFCKTFAENKFKSNATSFDVNIFEGQALISSEEQIIFDIQEQVELFRELALEVFETRSEVKCVFVPIIHYLFLRKTSPKAIDLTDWISNNVKGKLDDVCFGNLVRPHLHDLFDSLTLDYFESKTTQLIQKDGLTSPSFEKVTTIKLVLKRDHEFAYPIAPAMIPPVSHPDHCFYERYKSGKCCDYSIISSEGKKLRVHSIVLDIYGGSYFQSLLSSNMKETVEQSIKMDYPFDLIQHVVDSLYLGPRHLEKKLLKGEEMDVYGILQFAHAFDLQPLFKQMINLLMLFASPSDAETINELANYYRDDDLHRLANHLSPSKFELKV